MEDRDQPSIALKPEVPPVSPLSRCFNGSFILGLAGLSLAGVNPISAIFTALYCAIVLTVSFFLLRDIPRTIRAARAKHTWLNLAATRLNEETERIVRRVHLQQALLDAESTALRAWPKKG